MDSDAGLQAYSIFEKGGHVFSFMEVDDPEAIQEVMNNSEAQTGWAEVMSGITVETDNSWMGEIYRMIQRSKETVVRPWQSARHP